MEELPESGRGTFLRVPINSVVGCETDEHITSKTMSRPNSSIKYRLRRWVPPDAIALDNALLRHGIRFKGEYATWAEAEAHATGYQEQTILVRAVAATEAVRSGRAAWDRDGVTFAAPTDPYPMLAGLLLAAPLA